MLTNPSAPQGREVAGFLLSLAFAGLAAVRDVYFGGLFQHVNPLDVALVAFGLSTVGFLPFALARDRGGLAMLVRRPARLVWINVTTALAWLSFLFALGTVEPALVQVLFYGIGPLPATLFALRFPGAIGLAAVFALVSPAPLLSGITPGLLGAVVLACLLLIVLPNYVNQVCVALASPVTVRTVLAVGPVLVFGLQLFDGRLSSSRATLVVCVLYGVGAVAAANARRQTIGAMVGLSGTPAASRSGPCYH